MTQKEAYVELLMKAGLSQLQSRIYITLLITGTVNVGYISRASRIARQNVYRILPELESLGLVQRIIDKPILFKPTPLKQALELLLKKKKFENEQIQQGINGLNCDFSPFMDSLIEDERLIVSSEFWNIANCHKELFQESVRNIDIINQNIPAFLEDHCIDIESATKRGVNVRLAVQQTKISIPNRLLRLTKNPLFKLKYITEKMQTSQEFGLIIFDGRRICLSITEKGKTSRALTTSNSNLLRISKTFFEYIWDMHCQSFEKPPITPTTVLKHP
ncbi:MAG: TrmB family transcriptional regulator [Bacillota bacterium]